MDFAVIGKIIAWASEYFSLYGRCHEQFYSQIIASSSISMLKLSFRASVKRFLLLFIIYSSRTLLRYFVQRSYKLTYGCSLPRSGFLSYQKKHNCLIHFPSLSGSGRSASSDGMRPAERFPGADRKLEERRRGTEYGRWRTTTRT